jgi:hypothetical protein
MRVLFLDVDGVLNNYYTGGRLTLCKRRVRRLHRVVSATGCDLVVSSTWRLHHDGWGKLSRTLGYRGMTLADKTPDLVSRNSAACRGDEIAGWLGANAVDCYAIVDDEGDLLDWQRPYHVQTAPRAGLTDEDADRLIEILGA